VSGRELYLKNLLASLHLPIASHIRLFSFAMDRWDIRLLPSQIIQDAECSSAVLRQLLPSLSSLRELTLLYVAPRQHIDQYKREGYIDRPPPYYTPLYLEEIDLSALSQLPDLRKGVITGSHHGNEGTPNDEDKETHLRAITERARLLKSEFRGEVKVCVQFLC
jgi:hypothetical protein